MSWLFSQALVAAYSEANSSDGALSAPLKSTPTPQAYLWRDKTTDAWTRFPSGMTCEPLTADRGAAVLTWFLEGFPVRTSALPEKEPESKDPAVGFGLKWPESFARWDRASSSWRTRQLWLSEDLAQSLETWPHWGMMHDWECWVLDTQEGVADEIGSGYLPAPCASDGTHHGKEKYISSCRQKRRLKGASPPTERITYVYYEAGIPSKYFPEISEGMMSWPHAWTDLRPLGTGKMQTWLDSHGRP